MAPVIQLIPPEEMAKMTPSQIQVLYAVVEHELETSSRIKEVLAERLKRTVADFRK